MADGIVAELRRIPPVTRSMLGLLGGTTLPVLLGLVHPYYILYSPQRIFQKLELWRAITPFFFGGGGLQLLFDTLFFFRNSTALETQQYAERPSDYVTTLVHLMGAILVTNYPLRSVAFWHPFLCGLTYLWSQIDPTAPVSIFGLPPFKALFFPYALLALDLLQGGPAAALNCLSGLVAGWVVHFGHSSGGGAGRKPWFLQTPRFLQKLLGDLPEGERGSGVRLGAGTAFAPTRSFGGQAPVAPAGRAAAGPPPEQASGTRHRWGSGQRLG